MNRAIGVASIVVTVAFALRPKPHTVLLEAAEETVAFDTVAQVAVVHAVVSNNTRDTTYFLGCLGVPALNLERHVAGHWIAAGYFPCPMHKAYPVSPLRRGEAIRIPVRVRAPGEYRLKAVWGWRGQDRLHHSATSLAFDVR